jgi:hypothetical protein
MNIFQSQLLDHKGILILNLETYGKIPNIKRNTICCHQQIKRRKSSHFNKYSLKIIIITIEFIVLIVIVVVVGVGGDLTNCFY